MKTLITLSLLFFGLSFHAQSENELVTIVARICQTDSAGKVFSFYDQDSTLSFNMQTPDYNEFGANTYEYEKFDLVFDVSSNLLFSAHPFGKIDFLEYGKKKCKVVIEIAGAGDREKAGLWTFAVYEFSRPKGGQWWLAGAEYYFDDYYVGKEIK
jgi:hypothetical protein